MQTVDQPLKSLLVHYQCILAMGLVSTYCFLFVARWVKCETGNNFLSTTHIKTDFIQFEEC